jgi:hypothetical protein
MARGRLRPLCGLSVRSREPLPRGPLHRLGPRRWLRRVDDRPGGLRPAPAGGSIGPGRRAAPVRRGDRLSRPQDRRRAARQPPGPVRLRRVGAACHPGRPALGLRGLRGKPERGRARARHRPRRNLGRWLRRPAAGRPRRGCHVRARGQRGRRGTPGARSRRDRGDQRDPSRPGAGVPLRAPLGGAQPAERGRTTPAPMRASSSISRPGSRSRPRWIRSLSRMARRPSERSPVATSPARPCWSWTEPDPAPARRGPGRQPPAGEDPAAPRRPAARGARPGEGPGARAAPGAWRPRRPRGRRTREGAERHGHVNPSRARIRRFAREVNTPAPCPVRRAPAATSCRAASAPVGLHARRAPGVRARSVSGSGSTAPAWQSARQARARPARGVLTSPAIPRQTAGRRARAQSASAGPRGLTGPRQTARAASPARVASPQASSSRRTSATSVVESRSESCSSCIAQLKPSTTSAAVSSPPTAARTRGSQCSSPIRRDSGSCSAR